MLLVVARLPVSPQNLPEEIPLRAQHSIAEQEHNRQYPAGVVHLVAQKQQAQQHRHIQGICPPQAQQLIPQPLPPEALIQPEGGVGKQLRPGIDRRQRDVCTQRHRDNTVKDGKPYPEGRRKGQEQNGPVAEHMKGIQQLLILSDHPRLFLILSINS